jgi:hypothetical protein
MPNPGMAYGPGMILSLLDSFLQSGREQQAQQWNREGLTGTLQGASYMGGNPFASNTINIPGGGSATLPYNPTQGIDDIRRDIGGQLRSDNAGARAAYEQYMGQLFGTQGRLGEGLQGMFDRGAGTLTGAAKGREDRVLGELGRRGEQSLGDWGRRTGQVFGDYDSRAQSLKDYGTDRYQRGLANLEGMGNQARKNINEQYDNSAGTLQAQLQSRGLGNSTLLSGAMTANERERSRATGELDESIRQQRLNTDASLSGDVLNLTNQLFGNRTNLQSALTGDEAMARERFNQNYTGALSGLTGDTFNTQSQLFGNRMNLQGGLNDQAFNLQSSLGAGQMDLINQGRSNLTNFNQGLAQQRFGVGQGANQFMLNTLAGVSYPYPESINPLLQSYGQGVGNYQTAQNIQHRLTQANEMSWMPQNWLHGGIGMNGSGGLTSNFFAGI